MREDYQCHKEKTNQQYQQYINDRRRRTMIIGSMREYQKQYQQDQSRGPPIVAAGFRD
jgi:hypothetical protein